MNFPIEEWMEQYIEAMRNNFDSRIRFLGLQGSYGRGEATENSDIDVVLILDYVSADDLERYSKILDTLPKCDKLFGFVSGEKEVLAWEPFDLFQFYYDTTPILGSLDKLLNNIHESDIRRAVRVGACNVYHTCAHNIVHEKSTDILKGLYKSAGFTLQAIAFLKTGQYEKKKTDIVNLFSEKDSLILKAYEEIKNKEIFTNEEFKFYSGQLLKWASEWICEV